MSLGRSSAIAGALVLVAGCAPADIAPVPVGLDARVASARNTLERESEGLLHPSFAFVEIRCRNDGGAVVIFAEQGFGAGGFAYAMQGGNAVADSWAGGFGVDDPDADTEIAGFFEFPMFEVPCAR